MPETDVMLQHILTELRETRAAVDMRNREAGETTATINAIHQTCAVHDRAIQDLETAHEEVESNLAALRAEHDETRVLVKDMVAQAGRNTLAITEVHQEIKELAKVVSTNSLDIRANAEVGRHLQADDGPIRTLSKDVDVLSDRFEDIRKADTVQRLGIAFLGLLQVLALGWLAFAEKVQALFAP